MKIILLQDVPKIGSKYEVKEVRSGFARNFLLSKKLAEPATEKALKRIKLRQAASEAEKKVQTELLAKNIYDLNGAKIYIKEKANDKGHLFAGIHKKEIVLEIKEQTRLDVPEEYVLLEEPIRETGEYSVTIAANDKKAGIVIVVEKE